jgi:phage gpG-like protein
MDFPDFASFTKFMLARDVELTTAEARVAAGAAEIMYKKAHDIYGDEAKLAPLKPSTIAKRAAHGDASPTRPLLIDGSLLQASLQKGVEPAAEGVVAAIGSAEIIHAYHEFGYRARDGSPVPPRPVLKLALAESAPAIGALIQKVIGTALGFGNLWR